jgi:hypothetical protein
MVSMNDFLISDVNSVYLMDFNACKYVKTLQPEALKSLYRSPGYKKNQLVLCKNYVLQW